MSISIAVLRAIIGIMKRDKAIRYTIISAIYKSSNLSISYWFFNLIFYLAWCYFSFSLSISNKVLRANKGIAKTKEAKINTKTSAITNSL